MKYRYELDTFTARMVRFVAITGKGEAIRNHDFPYPYISKKVWDTLGQPHVIEIEIRAILPD